MDLESFFAMLAALPSEEEVLDFCRKHVLHGTPFVFSGRDEEFYDFRKRIGEKFDIPYHEIYITGSSKLGFSPYKEKSFDFDSDIDVAIVSPILVDEIMRGIARFQMQFRRNRAVVREKELEMYHMFLEYVALGWIRPDKLPVSFQMKAFKDDWFEFFRGISNGRSEVGNYQVNGGIFKSYDHLENYVHDGILEIHRRKKHRNKQ